MKKFMCSVIFSLMMIGTLSAEHKELKAFPKAEKGMERFVIELPHRERGEEDSYKVEIIPGKTMLTDGVNRMRVGLSVQGKPLIIRYNSRLPVVIYAPKGTEIRWRIWEAPEKLEQGNKG